jgi:peptide/nickel transport system permease protein
MRELGDKHADEAAIQDIIKSRGWDKPLFLNAKGSGLQRLTDTRFADHMARLLFFRFGRSDKTNEPIGRKILQGMVPSLTLTVPMFLVGLVLGLLLSLVVAYFRATYLDLGLVVVCVAFMSVSILVYIIGGQFVLAQYLRMFPVYGYAPGLSSLRFVLLPVAIAVLKGLGGDVRFYRTIMLEEVNKDYVRTARAKGLSERMILLKHVLKNAMIPVLTQTVLQIPFLFMGSLLLERFFGIPGLGNMTIEAIESADFQVLSAMVYLGGILFAFGNLATDISYTLVDPRVRFQ